MPEDKTTSDYVLRTLEAKDMAIASLTQKNKELEARLSKASSLSSTINAIGENAVAIAVVLFVIGVAVSGIVSSFVPACPVSTQIENPR